MTISGDSIQKRPSVIKNLTTLSEKVKKVKPKGARKAALTYGHPSIAASNEHPRFDFDLKLSLEKEYCLSDVLPMVADTGLPRFDISFSVMKVKIASIPFEGLQDLCLPIHLPEVGVSVSSSVSLPIRIVTTLSLDGKTIARGSFPLPERSGSSTTGVVMKPVQGFSECDDGLLPGTQPPGLKISIDLTYSPSSTSSALPSPSQPPAAPASPVLLDAPSSPIQHDAPASPMQLDAPSSPWQYDAPCTPDAVAEDGDSEEEEVEINIFYNDSQNGLILTIF